MKMKNLKLECYCRGHGHPETYEAEFGLKADYNWDALGLDGITIRVIVDEDGNVTTKVNKQKETAQ